ncbi:hypothetical protein ACFLS1_08030, partial [Verrucomicrobiota bacterium]
NPEVENIIARMIKTEPFGRYPTYDSLISDMQRVVRKMGGGHIKKTKKFIAKKQSGRLGRTTGPIEKIEVSPAPATVHNELSEGRDALAKYKQQALQSSPKKKKKRSKAPLWILLIILLAGAGTGLGIYLKNRNEEIITKRRALLELAGQKKTADKEYSKIQAAMSGVANMDSTANSYIETAKDAVFVVLGRKFDEPEPKPEPKEKPIEPKPAPTSSPDSGIPEGVMSSAHKKNISWKQDEKKETIKPEKTSPESEPEIKVLARKVIANAEIVLEKVKAVKTAGAPAKEINNLAMKSFSTIESEAQVRTAPEMLTLTANIKTQFDKLADISKSLREHKKAAVTALEQAEKDLKKVESIRDQIVQQREEAERQRLAAIKAAQDAEAKKQQEAAHKAQVEKETLLASSAHISSLVLIQQNKFKEAAEEVKNELPNFQTDEGKAIMQRLIDRYTRLHNLKLFIIEELNKEPLRWGWIQDSKKDVMGADESCVKLDRRTIPWERIRPPQMLKFMNYYLLTSKEIRRTTVAKQCIAAAIYCFENGGDEASAAFSFSAWKTQKVFINKALSINHLLEDDIAELLTPTEPIPDPSPLKLALQPKEKEPEKAVEEEKEEEEEEEEEKEPEKAVEPDYYLAEIVGYTKNITYRILNKTQLEAFEGAVKKEKLALRKGVTAAEKEWKDSYEKFAFPKAAFTPRTLKEVAKNKDREKLSTLQIRLEDEQAAKRESSKQKKANKAKSNTKDKAAAAAEAAKAVKKAAGAKEKDEMIERARVLLEEKMNEILGIELKENKEEAKKKK